MSVTLTIRNLEPELKEVLRVRAARNGRSMAAELRDILRRELGGGSGGGLASAIHRRFAPLGGVEVPELPDAPVGAPPQVG